MPHLAELGRLPMVTLCLGDLLIQGLKCLHHDAAFPAVDLQAAEALPSG